MTRQHGKNYETNGARTTSAGAIPPRPYRAQTPELRNEISPAAALHPLVDAEPLHEGLHARLILALARGGEQGTSLAFSSLDDPYFANFLVNRAQSWSPSR